MKTKNVDGKNEWELRYGYAFATFPFKKSKNRTIKMYNFEMKIKNLYTLLGYYQKLCFFSEEQAHKTTAPKNRSNSNTGLFFDLSSNPVSYLICLMCFLFVNIFGHHACGQRSINGSTYVGSFLLQVECPKHHSC